jgi:GT2 family glycosyltransferase
MKKVTVILLAWRDDREALMQADALLSWRNIKPSVILIRNQVARPSPPDRASLSFIDHQHNAGYAGGINAGLRSLECDADQAILLMNNDVEIKEETIVRLIEHLEAKSDVGIIGPVLEEKQGYCLGGRDPLFHVNTRIFAKPEFVPDAKLLQVDYVPGTVLLMRSRVPSDVGFLSESYFFSGEVADFCRRARLAGWHCAIATDACARHLSTDGSGLRETLYRYYTLRNRFLTARNAAPRLWPLWGLFWTAVGIIMACRLMLLNQPASRAVGMALVDGWQGRFGNKDEQLLA